MACHRPLDATLASTSALRPLGAERHTSGSVIRLALDGFALCAEAH